MNLKQKIFSVICLLSVSLFIHAETDVQEQAEAISKKYIIADLHVDVPYRLKEQYEDVSQATESGDFDYPRAKKGGLDAPFMSIYIPASIEADGGDSTAVANELIDGVEKMVDQSPDKFALRSEEHTSELQSREN